MRRVKIIMGQADKGAPIVVTKIEPEILLQSDYVRPQFKIYIENKGTGYVTNAASCAVTNINDQYTSGRSKYKHGYLMINTNCSAALINPDNKTRDSESFIRCYLPSDNTHSLD